MLWHGLLDIAKKYSIIIDNQVLLLIRATLINETSAFRLYHDLDIAKTYRKFETYRAEQARRRAVNSVLDKLDGEVDERMIIRMDRIAYTLQGLFFRTRHMLSLPSVNFSTLIGKWSFAFFVTIRFAFQLLLLTGAALLITTGFDIINTVNTESAQAVLQQTINNPLYLVLALVLLFANGRSVLFRLEDIDVK